MGGIHWSVWLSITIAIAAIAWFVRPDSPEEDPFRIEELEVTGGDALGIAVALGSLGLAVWLVYYLVKVVFWN